MHDPTPQARTPALRYDTPLAVGQVRVHRAADRELYIDVGPPPPLGQIASIAPVGVLFLFLCAALGLLVFSIAFRPSAIPYNKLLLLPTIVALGFAGAELLAVLRQWPTPSRLSVLDGRFAFPYPSPRSAAEEVDAASVRRVHVVVGKSRLTRRPSTALEIELVSGPRFRLYRGYPRQTLDELTDVLGPALGLVAAD